MTDAAAGEIELYGVKVRLDKGLAGYRTGDAVALAVRPEAVALGEEAGREVRVQGVVQEVGFLGSVIRIRVKVGSSVLSLDSFNKPAAPPPKAGETVTVSFAAGDLLVLGE
ncbi:MAG: TOBE domain-containing protein [Thiolinea sp.]